MPRTNVNLDKTQVEYIMRVKLPSSGGFHSSPSGDTDYEEAYRKAIMSKLPVGFEIAWKTKQTWPVDRDGLTWVKLYCSNAKDAMNYWMNEAHSMMQQLVEVKDLANKISNL